MKEKFKDISVDKDTLIIDSMEVNIETHEAIYQKWHWDGIHGDSIIFCNEDIDELSEEQIKNQVKNTKLFNTNSQITFIKGEKYTFVNFNFTI